MVRLLGTSLFNPTERGRKSLQLCVVAGSFHAMQSNEYLPYPYQARAHGCVVWALQESHL